LADKKFARAATDGRAAPNPPESEIVPPLSPDGVPVCVNATDAIHTTENCIGCCNEIDP
jgi:hypothetical protein